MFRSIFIIFGLLIFQTVSGQIHNHYVDSISKSLLGANDNKKNKVFLDIISKRDQLDLYLRIDTTKFDYAFIIEKFNKQKKEYTIEEFYFLANDTIPQYLILNAKPYNTAQYYDMKYEWYFELTRYHETLNPMLGQFDTLLPFQSLSYDKNIIIQTGCVTNPPKENAKAKHLISVKEKILKNTCQILTMINKKNNKLIISFQTPPPNFRFDIIRYNAVWDF